MFSLHPVSQAVITCVHTVCAVGTIGDIRSPVLFEGELNLNCCGSILISHCWRLTDSQWWVTKWGSTGRAPKLQARWGTQSGGNTISECH